MTIRIYGNCSFEGCDRHATTKADLLCAAHRAQKRAGKELKPLRVKARGEKCAYAGCDWPCKSKGYCGAHYAQKLSGKELRPVVRRADKPERRDYNFALENRVSLQCMYEGCERQVSSVTKALCQTHMRHLRVFGELRPIDEGRGDRSKWVSCPVTGCRHERNPFNGSPMCNRCNEAAKRFGMSREAYAEMMTGAICGICHRGDEKLQVDHDHTCCPDAGKSCGKCVRGPLCGRCNWILGQIEDDRSILASAIAYLDSFSPR